MILPHCRLMHQPLDYDNNHLWHLQFHIAKNALWTACQLLKLWLMVFPTMNPSLTFLACWGITCLHRIHAGTFTIHMNHQHFDSHTLVLCWGPVTKNLQLGSGIVVIISLPWSVSWCASLQSQAYDIDGFQRRLHRFRPISVDLTKERSFRVTWQVKQNKISQRRCVDPGSHDKNHLKHPIRTANLWSDLQISTSNRPIFHQRTKIFNESETCGTTSKKEKWHRTRENLQRSCWCWSHLYSRPQGFRIDHISLGDSYGSLFLETTVETTETT